jgi:DNA mismatch repair protein MutS
VREGLVAETPLMRQYNEIKAKYPDAILLFRVGDFFETFGEDAVRAASILGITLTKRANGAASHVELAGFPHHALETYLPKLVKAGQRVAVCEQLEDPKLAKKIVKRGITELVTPGVAFSDNVLDRKSNNFLAAVYLNHPKSGVAFIDVSTGEFFVAEGGNEYIARLLQNMQPSEVLVKKTQKKDFYELFGPFNTFGFDDWMFSLQYAKDILLRQFETENLKGFGIEMMESAIIAAGVCLHYVNETRQENYSAHIRSISRIDNDDYVWLDKFTIRNLELVQSYNERGKTLLATIDRTTTPMGGRLLQRWILLPLINKAKIDERLDAVECFHQNKDLSFQTQKILTEIADIERICAKLAVGKINPREFLTLAYSIEKTKELCSLIYDNAEPLRKIISAFKNLDDLSVLIKKHIREDTSTQIVKGGVICSGINKELDELRLLSTDSKNYLAGIQQNEALRTGISSLKIGFNNVFGYYLEVTNTHKDKVPAEWIRKQTLTNAERYITSELKIYEEKILGAEEKILRLEQEIYSSLIQQSVLFSEALLNNASLLAMLDVYLSFALIATENNYCRPILNDNLSLNIKNGRHPVIETQLPLGEKYVENDVYLSSDDQQIIILTGPNMAGKSALLRQTALIVLLAQCGSFVPASHAEIGLVDKIFTRVGASDNLSSGESTFMVEMNETASILNNLSLRSLILLDEIGRGTSTYDGISIAWSITEFLHNHPLYKPKTLFATHYHELNEIATYLPRVSNYHISVKESNNNIVFIRKLTPGGTEHSFGIHVARMAGVPRKIIERAEEILKRLEKEHGSDISVDEPNKTKTSSKPYQLSLIQLDDPVLENIREEILNTNIDMLTPVEALMKLNSIKNILEKNKK